MTDPAPPVSLRAPGGAAPAPEGAANIVDLAGAFVGATPASMRAMLDVFGIAAFVVERDNDGDWRYVAVNAACEELIGRRHADMAGRLLPDVWPADITRRLRADHARCLETRGFDSFERISPLSGNQRWYRVRQIALRAPGLPPRVLGTLEDIDTLKRSTAALAESERALRRALRMGRMGHWRLDVATGVFTWSDTLYAFLGFDRRSFSPTLETLVPYFAGADRKRFRAIYTRSVRNRTGASFEIDVIKPNGERRSVFIEAEAEMDQGGRLLGFFGVTKDVTDDKSAQRALEVSEGNLRRAQRIGGMGHWQLDLRSNQLIFSEQLYSIHGLRPDDFALSQRKVLEHFDAQTAAEVAAMHTAAVKNGTGYVYEAETWRVDTHEPLSIRVVAEPEFSESGQVVGFFGTTQDITERRQAERRLIESETNNRAIIEALNTAQIGLATMDWRGHLISMSASLAHMIGIEHPALAYGRYWGELPGSWSLRLEPLLPRVLALLKEGRTWEGEIEWERSEEDLHQALIRVTAIDASRLLVIVVDQTEIRRARILQARIERNLEATQKMDALGQLASGIAHEVNNLLQPILTFARHAQRTQDSTQRNAYLDQIATAATGMRDMLAQLLGFARPSTDQPAEYDVCAQIRSAVDFVRPSLSPLIQFDLAEDPCGARALVNVGEFRQVLVNLILNASDAMNAAGTITIRAQSVAGIQPLTVPPLAAGHYVRIDVHDHGHGMDETARRRLFEPFYSTKPAGAGTGLGMAVVYGIVTRWGGGLAVDSEPDRGTTISLFLPLAMPAPAG